MEKTLSHFNDLVATIHRLRDESGCPWDRRQTTDSLVKYLNEEFCEITAAIEQGDRDNLCEELGDFLYLIIMLAEINAEEHFFTLDDVLITIRDKLVRRHPHVFAGAPLLDEEALTEQWRQIKAQEKAGKG
ncbi:MAG: nucleotide pyrophosphohydrolase [Desulfofustis sp.]|nr:nucleotide pyrophosphohydrolase [Desulfofustis sp.]